MVASEITQSGAPCSATRSTTSQPSISRWPSAVVSNAAGTGLRTQESAQMLRVDDDLDTCAGLVTQACKDRFGNITEHLNPHRPVESLLICPASVIRDHVHVLLEGCRVRMYLDDRHLVAAIVDVLLETDHLGLLALHEAHELGHAAALGAQRPALQAICRDEDQWARHGNSIES